MSKRLPDQHRKSIIFTTRISPEQEQYLEFSSQTLADIFGKTSHEISKAFCMQKLMEFGRAEFEQWVVDLKVMSREQRKDQIA